MLAWDREENLLRRPIARRVEHQELALARIDRERLVADQPRHLVGEKAGAVDEHLGVRRTAVWRAERHARLDRGEPEADLKLCALTLGLGCERARVHDRVGHRLAGHLQRLLVWAVDHHAVALGARHESLDPPAVAVHHGAAAQHRDAEPVEQRFACPGGRQYQLGFELSRDRIEPGVKDS